MRNTPEKEKGSDLLIRGWYLFAAGIGAICLYHLAAVGEASLSAVFLGYSPSRLLMMGFLLVCTLAGFLAFLSNSPKITQYIAAASGSGLWKTLLTLLFLLFSLAWILGGFVMPERYLPYFERIQPLLIYGMAVCGTGCLLFFRLSSQSNAVGTERSAIRKTAVLYFIIAFAVYLLIRITGIGITPDEMDWQPVGMAVHYWELFLSLWIALAVSVLLNALHAGRNVRLTTAILFFAVWACVAVLWTSVPSIETLDHSYFMESSAPDHLPFPASDSAYYGLWAESVLAGLGFKSTIVTRPFLILTIAFLEKLTGRDILRTIDCLTVILALIPAFLFLLGTRLHSHGAGLLAAGLGTLREYNTLWLAPHYMVSNSKMFLSDLPAMLCLLAALCAAVSWFQKPRSLWRMLLCACLAGFSVTVRSQLILLIPVLPLVFLLQKGIPFRVRLKFTAGFAGIALLMLLPWLVRSKIITGSFILDEPGIHSTELARRWSDDVNNVVEREEGESDADYAARNRRHMVEFLREKPLYVMHFIASHFGSNELSAFTALPFGTDPKLTVRDVTDTGFHDVTGRLLKAENIPSLLLFLAFIVMGLSASRRRAGMAGLLPFLVCTLYHLLTACGRYSGWRFALPADWIYYFCFALGAAEVFQQIAAWLGFRQDSLLTVQRFDPAPQPLQTAASASIFLMFLLLALAPALCRQIIPQQLFEQTTEENTAALQTILSDSQQLSLAELLADPEKSVHSGRIIYPRYFYQGQGLASGHPWTAYKIRDFSRLGFVLLNEENFDVILPLEEEPAFIENAADIYVIGSENEEGYYLADAIIIPQTDPNAAPRILTSDKQE